MKLSILNLITEDKRKEETRSYKITGRSDHLDTLERYFSWIDFCGSAGHSASSKFSVDGDGAGRVKFEGLKKSNKPKDTELDENGEPEFHSGLD